MSDYDADTKQVAKGKALVEDNALRLKLEARAETAERDAERYRISYLDAMQKLETAEARVERAERREDRAVESEQKEVELRRKAEAEADSLRQLLSEKPEGQVVAEEYANDCRSALKALVEAERSRQHRKAGYQQEIDGALARARSLLERDDVRHAHKAAEKEAVEADSLRFALKALVEAISEAEEGRAQAWGAVYRYADKVRALLPEESDDAK